MSETEREGWVDAKAVAEHLGVSVDWVYDKAAKNKLPSKKIGGHRRFKLSHVDESIEADGSGTVTEPTSLHRR